MASPTVASNPPAATTTNGEQRSRMIIRKKKKKANHQSAKQALNTSDQPQLYGNSWESQTQQQIYSFKLLKALRHVTSSGAATSGSAAAAAPKRGREVRDAAERALAATAKGRSRWSRAILTPSSRLKLNYLRKRSNRPRTSSALASVTGSSRSKKPRVSVYRLKGKSLPAVQRKVRVLGRLVPGCRKQPLPVILDETFDYIEAKLMQIRAMTELIDRLAGSFSAASASASAPSPPT